MLPISMVGGVLFHNYMESIAWMSPFLIFCMLTVTFTRIKLREMRITRFHLALLALQMVACWAVYYALYPISPVVAEGAFLCVYMPTATAAPVVTGMLGGSVSMMATLSVLSNLSLAVTAPMFLSAISVGHDIEFADSFMRIGTQVVPMIVVPLILALAMRKFVPRLHKAIAAHQGASFWMWAVALFVVIGNAVTFVMKQPLDQLWVMVSLAMVSLVVCVLQFAVGRRIGVYFGDKVAGAQGMGQKNTILALWLSLTYLNPIISIAPAAYIAWQNIINSAQLYRKAKRGEL